MRNAKGEKSNSKSHTVDFIEAQRVADNRLAGPGEVGFAGFLHAAAVDGGRTHPDVDVGEAAVVEINVCVGIRRGAVSIVIGSLIVFAERISLFSDS